MERLLPKLKRGSRHNVSSASSENGSDVDSDLSSLASESSSYQEAIEGSRILTLRDVEESYDNILDDPIQEQAIQDENSLSNIQIRPDEYLDEVDDNPYEAHMHENSSQMSVYAPGSLIDPNQYAQIVHNPMVPDEPVAIFVAGYPVCVSIKSSGSVPQGPVIVGPEDMQLILLGRGAPPMSAGLLLPARVDVQNLRAYASYEGVEYTLDYFEVLLVLRGRLQWVPCNDGEVPEDAYPVGMEGMEPVYAARVYHANSWIPGRVSGDHEACIISTNGVEIAYRYYEVLVISKS